MDEIKKKMKGILLTAEHIGFMEAQTSKANEYKVLALRDELDEMIESLMTLIESEVFGSDLNPNTSSGADNE